VILAERSGRLDVAWFGVYLVDDGLDCGSVVTRMESGIRRRATGRRIASPAYTLAVSETTDDPKALKAAAAADPTRFFPMAASRGGHGRAPTALAAQRQRDRAELHVVAQGPLPFPQRGLRRFQWIEENREAIVKWALVSLLILIAIWISLAAA
jgi:hypothetical protein